LRQGLLLHSYRSGYPGLQGSLQDCERVSLRRAPVAALFRLESVVDCGRRVGVRVSGLALLQCSHCALGWSAFVRSAQRKASGDYVATVGERYFFVEG